MVLPDARHHQGLTRGDAIKSKSTRPSRPSKSSRDFPLFPHRAGYLAKKVRGKTVYFTKVRDDPKGEQALAIWRDEQADILLTGRRPEPKQGLPTVESAVNAFLHGKDLASQSGEIKRRTFLDAVATCKRVVDVLGRHRLLTDLGPADFQRLKQAISKVRNTLVGLGNEIVRARAPFIWAYKNDLIDRPIKFGTDFAQPPKRKQRAQQKQNRPEWTYKPSEVHAMLVAAGVHLRAMIYLGVQAGFGPGDIAGLPLSVVDLDRGWIDFPRPKTGIERRVPLWSETVEALKASRAQRPEAKADEARDLFFVAKYGKAWGDGTTRFPVSGEFLKLLRPLGLSRHGRGFYALRHTFRTIAGCARDVEAIRSIMGHANDHVEATYTHSVEDSRLRAVVDHVHAWLFASEPST